MSKQLTVTAEELRRNDVIVMGVRRRTVLLVERGTMFVVVNYHGGLDPSAFPRGRTLTASSAFPRGRNLTIEREEDE